MALFRPGQSRCGICGRTIQLKEELVAFPAFLPRHHRLAAFSDSMFHIECFKSAPDSDRVHALYARYREIWESRPSDLKTREEIERWGRLAFREFDDDRGE